MNKVIYLKSLVKDFKPKLGTFPKDLNTALENMGIDLVPEYKKPKSPKVDTKAGRAFILTHTEEFLRHAIEYSLYDKVDAILRSKE